MFKMIFPLHVAVLMLFSGCQTLDPGGSTRSPQAEETIEFRLVLESDPPGARAVIRNGDRRIEGQQTPGLLRIRFDKVRERSQAGWPRTVWQPRLPEISPWRLRETPDAFVLSLDNLELHKKGYEPQAIDFTWRIPRGMREPDSWGIPRIPVETEQELSVVLRNPSEPHLVREITLQSPAEGARIYTLDKGKGPGRFLGETPLNLRVGAAPIRDEAGTILNWRLWGGGGIWTVDQRGVLRLSAILQAGGYEMESFVQLPVLTFEGPRQARHDMSLIPLRPSAPQSTFRLFLDSLPSGAGLYLWRPNGTLGELLGTTPVEISIGIAQELQLTPSGQFAHKQWLIWGPESVIDVEETNEGIADLFIRGVLYREGLPPEFVHKQISQLRAGAPIPETKTLTIPIISPSHSPTGTSLSLSPRNRTIPTREIAPQPEARNEPEASQDLPPPASRARRGPPGR